MGMNTKIDWAEATWNPVTGCRNNCPYCYAKRIAERFAGYDDKDELNRYSFIFDKDAGIYEVDMQMTRIAKDGKLQRAHYPFGFVPTLHNFRLNEPKTWEPKNVFVCSMADLFADYIPEEWITKVFRYCDRYSQHRYLFLTKNPKRYVELFEKGLIPKNHENWWFGTTVTKPDQPYFWKGDEHCFLSVEPIQAEFEPDDGSFHDVQWVIIGAETGNRVGKVKPEKEWVDNIVKTVSITGTPVFMKESLRELMGDDFTQDYPWKD